MTKQSVDSYYIIDGFVIGLFRSLLFSKIHIVLQPDEYLI